MPLAGNSLNYANRTVDLLLLKTVLAAPVYRKRVDLDVEKSPMIVTGVEKLAQRYALLFITEVGTCHADPGRGTKIVSDVTSGKVYDDPTLTTAAAEANMLAGNQIKEEDAGLESPPDERLYQSEVTDIKMDKSSSTAMIVVRLTTEAGSSFDYVIPVGIGVRS